MVRITGRDPPQKTTLMSTEFLHSEMTYKHQAKNHSAMMASVARPRPGLSSGLARRGLERVSQSPLLVIESTLDGSPLPTETESPSSDVKLEPGRTVNFLMTMAITDITPSKPYGITSCTESVPCRLLPMQEDHCYIRMVGPHKCLRDPITHFGRST